MERASFTARMNETSRKPPHTVAELASARQPPAPENWPAIMERAVEGKAPFTACLGGGIVRAAIPCFCSGNRASMARDLEFAYSRAPYVHLRSPGSRPVFCRGLNEKFYIKKLK